MVQKKTEQINIKVTAEMKDSLLEYADSMHWTLSILCNEILTQWMNDAKTGKVSVFDLTKINQ